jgi:hypothetical protein
MSDTKATFSFAFKTLTPIVGEPTNVTLTKLKKELYANAVGTTSELGGGLNGYLGMVMPEAEYLAERNTAPFIAPNKPVAPIPNSIQTTEEALYDRETYKEALLEYKQHRAMGIELKEQLITAIEYRYLKPLEVGKTGLASVTVGDMLQYLTDTYDEITLEDIHNNMEKLGAPWNPEEPILDLWERIKECQRFAAEGGYPIDDKLAINMVLKALEATNLFTTWTTQMRDIKQMNWTMKMFQDKFNDAQKERSRQITTKSAGYHGAHMATKIAPSYAAAAATTIITPTVKNDNTTDFTSDYVIRGPKGKYMSYCYGHGYNYGHKHTSPTCRSKKEGHKDMATFFNNMGGCQDVHIGPRNSTNAGNNNTTGTSNSATVVNTSTN